MLCPTIWSLKPTNAGSQITTELNHKNSGSTKNHQNREISMGFEGQDRQEKRHINLIRDSQNKSRKETPPNPSKIPRKSSENHRKEKQEEQQELLRNHAEPSIHTMKDSYKV
jgi:hypothetical protein